MRNKNLTPAVKFVDSGFTILDRNNVDNYQKEKQENFLKLKAYVENEVMK